MLKFMAGVIGSETIWAKIGRMIQYNTPSEITEKYLLYLLTHKGQVLFATIYYLFSFFSYLGRWRWNASTWMKRNGARKKC